jgi:hypothetical protein
MTVMLYERHYEETEKQSHGLGENVYEGLIWWLLGPWHSWGGRKDPRLYLKTRPPDLWPLVSLPDCFSACKTTQELPVTHLARHVNLFHLVTADKQRPETLSLPHGLAPPINPLPIPAKPLHSEPKSDSLWSGFLINLSTCGVVLIRQYLTSMSCYKKY